MARRKNHPGHLAKRGQAYRWRVLIDGTHHRATFHTIIRKEAEKLARECYRELEKKSERKRDGLSINVTMAELFDEFERDILPALADGTQRSYRDSLKALRSYWVEKQRDPQVDKVRGGHIQSFITWRRTHRIGGGEVSNRTVAKDRTVLHRIFALAETMEYRDGNPVQRTHAPKWDGRDPVILSEDEYERLLQECGERDMLSLYVLILGDTGQRCESETLWTQWEDVDLEEGFLKVVSGRNGHRTKSGKARWVPMTPRLRQAMREHFARYRFVAYNGKQTPWVFHHTQTRRHHQAGQRIRSLYHAYKNAAKRAKLPLELVQHDLRHRRITVWMAEGKNPVHVMEAVGHADLRTTMAYTHLAREHLRGLVDQDPQDDEREALKDLA